MRTTFVWAFRIFIAFQIHFFFGQQAFAALSIPKNLSAADEDKFVRWLGLGLVPGIPFHKIPLGGYEGAEISLDYQTLETKNVAELGSRASSQEFTSLTYLTISKGIFYNIDMSFSFNPGSQQETIQSYFAHVRWTSDLNWELPLSYGFQVYGHGLQVNDDAHVKNLGIDFFTAYYLDDFAISGGVGFVRSIANFTGGSSGVTASSSNEQVDMYAQRWLAGVSGLVGRISWGIDVSQFSNLSVTGRIGYRF